MLLLDFADIVADDTLKFNFFFFSNWFAHVLLTGSFTVQVDGNSPLFILASVW